MLMKYIIIDTNVPLKAANTHPKDDIDRNCSQSCFSFISTLMKSKDKIIVLDSGREIVKEYEKNIDIHSERSVASEFLMWIYRNNLNGKICLQEITKTGENTYAEFPESPKLIGFDRSDRKFVALAKAHPSNPNIYNGSDTDWWDYREAQEEEGIHIVFLSEEYMKAKSKGGKK